MKSKPADKFRHPRAKIAPSPVDIPAFSSLTIDQRWPIVRLQPGRDHISRTFHPWIFSGAILELIPASGQPCPACLPSLVRVCTTEGAFVAWAQHNPASKIRLRLLEWQEDRIPDENWLEASLRAAFARRQGMHGGSTATSAVRLVFSEADNLPGLIVERMDRWLLVQSENSSMDGWMPALTRLLPLVAADFMENLAGIIERSDGDGRSLENLPARHGLLWGTAPGASISVQENDLDYQVDLMGQKTGFYTDQRENRQVVARYAAGRKILDVCSYSGGFSLRALKAGALGATLLDASHDALDLARRNLAGYANTEFIQGDAFQTLRRLRDEGRGGEWDLIILDPPKLAPSRNSLERALAAYKDLNLQALRLLAKGGLLASFSCSGLVSADDLRQAIAFAAKDLGRQVHILHHLHQAPCHPVLLSFPEGQYLKGFLLRVV